jgi:hypothetical protein
LVLKNKYIVYRSSWKYVCVIRITFIFSYIKHVHTKHMSNFNHIMKYIYIWMLIFIYHAYISTTGCSENKA